MESFTRSMEEYKQQLKIGKIQKAYKGLLEYLMALRTHLKKQHPEWLVPGGLYAGYMDMSYFSIIPPSLKERKLKIAVVFLHEECRFEVWLAGVNKRVQEEYWQMIKESGWDKFRVVSTTQGADAIIEQILVENPDFEDLARLTRQIETGTLKFIMDVEEYFNKR